MDNYTSLPVGPTGSILSKKSPLWTITHPYLSGLLAAYCPRNHHYGQLHIHTCRAYWQHTVQEITTMDNYTSLPVGPTSSILSKKSPLWTITHPYLSGLLAAYCPRNHHYGQLHIPTCRAYWQHTIQEITTMDNYTSLPVGPTSSILSKKSPLWTITHPYLSGLLAAYCPRNHHYGQLHIPTCRAYWQHTVQEITTMDNYTSLPVGPTSSILSKKSPLWTITHPYMSGLLSKQHTVQEITTMDNYTSLPVGPTSSILSKKSPLWTITRPYLSGLLAAYCPRNHHYGQLHIPTCRAYWQQTVQEITTMDNYTSLPVGPTSSILSKKSPLWTITHPYLSGLLAAYCPRNHHYGQLHIHTCRAYWQHTVQEITTMDNYTSLPVGPTSSILSKKSPLWTITHPYLSGLLAAYCPRNHHYGQLHIPTCRAYWQHTVQEITTTDNYTSLPVGPTSSILSKKSPLWTITHPYLSGLLAAYCPRNHHDGQLHIPTCQAN